MILFLDGVKYTHILIGSTLVLTWYFMISIEGEWEWMESSGDTSLQKVSMGPVDQMIRNEKDVRGSSYLLMDKGEREFSPIFFMFQ